MSRSLTLGNGNLLIGFDADGQVKDLYYPQVGLENHVGRGLIHRVGVWVDGTFYWFVDNAWDIQVGSEVDSQVGVTTAYNHELGISITITDVVYNEKAILVRKFLIKNERNDERVVKIFFGQEFQIYESSTAHTAYFDPDTHTVIHYKGKRVFLVNAMVDGKKFSEYTTGIQGIWNKEGSFRDAEEGILSKNPIEHGPADSVIGCGLRLLPREQKEVFFWMCAGLSIPDVVSLNSYVLQKGPQHLITTTTDFWRAWVSRRPYTFYGMGEKAIALFKRSLFTIRAHVDAGGAVIASSDSDILHQGKDSYAYSWPRDGAITTIALYQSGSYSPAKRFFEFCNRIVSDGGYFMHKYGVDGSLGSSWHPWVKEGKRALPIQEDETALVLYSLWRYYELSKDLEFIEEVYNTLIKKTAQFLCAYRDEKTGMPLPSYDIWEERYGVHTFTASSVFGALTVASKFATLLGKHDEALTYSDVAKEIQHSIIKHCYDAGEGFFYRSITIEGGVVHADRTMDASSAYGVFRFGVLPSTDERLMRAFTVTRKKLQVDTHIGGIKRYEHDQYFRSGDEASENAWFITSLWFAQFDIATAKDDAALDTVRKVFEWMTKYATPSGILSEQINPYTGSQVSVAPLVWSHAEYVITVLDYLAKLTSLGVCKECDPQKFEA